MLLFILATSPTTITTTVIVATTATTAATSNSLQPSSNSNDCVMDSSNTACQTVTDDETGNGVVCYQSGLMKSKLL